ncbi:cytochrome c family protein [Ensifer sp. WSM1721]|uniref:c-type cytochrome n=1 Tax=Ensifer sp. WSM1721 TaxID=1041159 RepID=UPI00210FBC2E|nr:c-type cytochrome [Ensifer sp. WSM1721]
MFGRCKACHVEDAERNAVGPHLLGVVGRPIAGISTFRYSSALTKYAQDGKVWDEGLLTDFLKAPRKTVPSTKMAFAGLKNDSDVRNVIAYLKSLRR